MKAAFTSAIIMVISAPSAIAANEVTKILEANFGNAIGVSSLTSEACNVQVYPPGEFVPDEAIYVEYGFEDSPAFHVEAFPEKAYGSWRLDEAKGLLTHSDRDASNVVQFAYDLKSLKFKSFLLKDGYASISCDDIH